MLWQVAVNEENRGKTVSFHHFTRWLSQVVFRDFAEISAGVIFHPLGSNRGLVFPLLLQPPRYCRFQAGICAEFDAQKTKKKYCHKMHQRLQREGHAKRFCGSRMSRCTVQKLRRYNQREVPTDFSLYLFKLTVGKSEFFDNSARSRWIFLRTAGMVCC